MSPTPTYCVLNDPHPSNHVLPSISPPPSLSLPLSFTAKMTSYGTIPSDSSSSSSPLPSSIGRAKERIQSYLTEQRPWKDIIQPRSFNLPTTLTHSFNRIRTNIAFFRVNYAIIVFSLLFLSLLRSPLSLLLLLVLVLLWLFLYFLRDNPFVLFGRIVDDAVVMMVLLLATVAILFLTDVTNNITVGVGVGVAVILAHGALRSTEDSFAEDEVGGAESATFFGGSGGGGAPLPLKNPASSSFTSS